MDCTCKDDINYYCYDRRTYMQKIYLETLFCIFIILPGIVPLTYYIYIIYIYVYLFYFLRVLYMLNKKGAFLLFHNLFFINYFEIFQHLRYG